ncbi:DeoR/GlpR transcriptional regulator [Acidisoma cellulosilytica]|uniref:DeoR/GlpR transcriptional regulator n=1 Tax=Acidisoma cellulosilyticum TaxID=2802395 RepID=A0A964E5I5_9PROT|nr:DeoR/GlpR family DNA-binding transcription regulator [Acidisoma cellulosilyticum]MCB8882018.1 DeoR/GlpR transcriptional regulator [Acidisoma cellulosilyticum]
MWVDERQQRIMEMIGTVGRVETDAIAAELQVSRETVRRDLLLLERDGKLRRVHGGAVRADPPPERPFRTRKRVQMDAKREIARTGVALIKPGSSCFIDAGTTTAAFAAELVRLSDLLVITNSLEVAMTLRAAQSNAEILLLGGRMGLEVPSTHGDVTIAEIGRHRVDVAILSPVALDASAGFTYHDLDEGAVARAMTQNAARILVLADHTKLGWVSRTVVCPCSEIDDLVSDADDDALMLYRQAGVRRTVSTQDS